MPKIKENYKAEFQRLLEIVKKKQAEEGAPSRNEDIAGMLGYNRSYFSQLLGKAGVVTQDHLRLLFLTFPWIADHTDMLGDVLDSLPRGTNGTEKRTYREELRDKRNAYSTLMVPLVPVKAQAGYASSYNNVDFINKLEMYPILPNVDPRGAVWRYFEVQGDSMEPGLFDSDLVLVSMVSPEDWRDIKKGQVYVIVTKDDVFVKQVYPNDKNSWVLRSSNKRHKDRIIQLEEVKELWQYRRHVTNKIQWPKESKG